MRTLHWQSLRDGDNERAIVAIDHGAGRREAGFPELAANLDGDELVIASQFDPAGIVALSAAAEADPERLRSEIEVWRDDLAHHGVEVAGVLSYCAGASLACALADCFTRQGAEPWVIMLDPIVVVPYYLLGRFVEAARSLTALLPDDTVGSAINKAEAEWEAHTDRPGTSLVRWAGRLCELYGELAHQACDDAELGDEAEEELAGHFAGVLHYLAVAGLLRAERFPPADAMRRTTVLVSRDHELRRPLPPASSVSAAGRDEFLADPGLVATLRATVAAR